MQSFLQQTQKEHWPVKGQILETAIQQLSEWLLQQTKLNVNWAKRK